MKTETKAELSLLFVTMIWGSGFPLTSIALKDVGPFTFVAIRSLLGALAFLVVFHKKIKEINRDILKGAVLISLALSIGNILQVVGLVYTTPSKSGFLTGLTVIFVPVIIAVIYKKLPDFKTIFSVVLCVIGLFVMSFNGELGINKGDLLTLMCAVAYSFQILLVDKYGRETDPIVLTCMVLIFVGVASILPAVFLEGFKINVNFATTGTLVYTAVMSTAVGMGVQNKMQPYVNPSHAAVIYLGEPVFGAIFSAFAGDILSGRALVGCILILFGMITATVRFKSIWYSFKQI